MRYRGNHPGTLPAKTHSFDVTFVRFNSAPQFYAGIAVRLGLIRYLQHPHLNVLIT